jgi:hypothetical protein
MLGDIQMEHLGEGVDVALLELGELEHVLKYDDLVVLAEGVGVLQEFDGDLQLVVHFAAFLFINGKKQEQVLLELLAVLTHQQQQLLQNIRGILLRQPVHPILRLRIIPDNLCFVLNHLA